MPDERDKADRGASPPDKGAPAPARTAGAFNDPGRSAPLGGQRRDAPGGRPAAASPPAASPVDPGVIAAATAAAMAAIGRQQAANAPTPDMDRTVPGGLYLVEGKVVDAWGNEREMPNEGEGDGPPPEEKP